MAQSANSSFLTSPIKLMSLTIPTISWTVSTCSGYLLQSFSSDRTSLPMKSLVLLKPATNPTKYAKCAMSFSLTGLGSPAKTFSILPFISSVNVLLTILISPINNVSVLKNGQNLKILV